MRFQFKIVILIYWNGRGCDTNELIILISDAVTCTRNDAVTWWCDGIGFQINEQCLYFAMKMLLYYIHVYIFKCLYIQVQIVKKKNPKILILINQKSVAVTEWCQTYDTF